MAKAPVKVTYKPVPTLGRKPRPLPSKSKPSTLVDGEGAHNGGKRVVC